jgi:hypothetical protein
MMLREAGRWFVQMSAVAAWSFVLSYLALEAL